MNANIIANTMPILDRRPLYFLNKKYCQNKIKDAHYKE